MKLKITVDPSVPEDEIHLRCHALSDAVLKLQDGLCDEEKKTDLAFYKDGQTYFLNVGTLLFFETSLNTVYAHTEKEMYQTKCRLYELESLLPGQFARISKSAIVNLDLIFALDKSPTSGRSVKFKNSYKTVYVSRSYYKAFKNKLDERRGTHA